MTGLLLFWVAPGAAKIRFDTSIAALKTLGVGFLCVVVIPIAAVVAAVTIVGLPLAILAFGVWGAGLYLAKIVVAAFVGDTLLGGSGRRLAVTLLTGLLVVFAAVNLPWVGGVVNVVLTIAGLGILYTTVTGWYRRELGPAATPREG